MGFPGFDTVVTLKAEFLSTTAPNSAMPDGFAMDDVIYCIAELTIGDVVLPVGTEGVVAGPAAAEDKIAVTFPPQVTDKFDIPVTALSKDSLEREPIPKSDQMLLSGRRSLPDYLAVCRHEFVVA